MAWIKSGRATVVAGITINALLVILKMGMFLASHVNAMFADAIDSIVDGFVMVLVLVFLKFDLDGKLTYLQMDMMLLCQWSTVIMFRIVIFMDQIGDLYNPEPRTNAGPLILVSAIAMVAAILVAVIFVDEDDVIKLFISDAEKATRKRLKKKKRAGGVKPFKLMPIFAEAMDNVVSTAVALLLGCLMYYEVALDYIYLIDDVSNMLISVVMCVLASNELRKLANKYDGKSYYEVVFPTEDTPLLHSS
ncbi:Aste57867_305 [Aphanomyces stellatus]|uniref:Aste57867_305 protein n=1 Tax=Aphanomyces stellatus TaxID=120398 RepID=A0A485K785_9STRA|nr:hypothetical protein As57867_000305 [Aphanomyces stellatus]VFT77531.1 Aste57867_305 [Aphanomyces stellatus]